MTENKPNDLYVSLHRRIKKRLDDKLLEIGLIEESLDGLSDEEMIEEIMKRREINKAYQEYNQGIRKLQNTLNSDIKIKSVKK